MSAVHVNLRRSLVATVWEVCHAIWSFCTCLSKRKKKRKTAWTETEETLLTDITAEADALVQGISETVFVLAWGAIEVLRSVDLKKKIKQEEDTGIWFHKVKKGWVLRNRLKGSPSRTSAAFGDLTGCLLDCLFLFFIRGARDLHTEVKVWHLTDLWMEVSGWTGG